MKTIFKELQTQLDHHCDCMLVTVVDGQGSAPRGAGAQMLVSARGRLAGTVGGGSLEYRAAKLAGELLQKKESRLKEFSLHRNGEENIGMICGGDVALWFQYIPAEDKSWRDLVDQVLDRLLDRCPGWFVQDLTGGQPWLTDCWTETPGFFPMPLPLGERAVIFGGGHIARALVPLLKSVGFRPVVYDCRPEYVKPEDFPAAEAVICGDYGSIDRFLSVTEADYVVVMTNGHAHDFEVQRQLLQRRLAYIGVIGSRKKTVAVNQRLLEAGISEETLGRVHAPIGTAIKAVTPEEIAVSIAGEMIYERALGREKQPHGCPMQG